METSTPPSSPKKDTLSVAFLQTPGESLGASRQLCEMKLYHSDGRSENISRVVIKNRYILSTPASGVYNLKSITQRGWIESCASNMTCTDTFTGKEYLCRIINEPFHKVQPVYCKLQNDEVFQSSLYGHALIRGAVDIVPLSEQQTYVVVPPWGTLEDLGETGEVFENLRAYVSRKHHLSEDEARLLFHQICQTVLGCHRNGIILRDLKLKRFHFIDKARTQLQYESLEGCILLNDANNDEMLSKKIGFPVYMAPELFSPNATYKGKPADIWSLGVMLYAMLVGQYPFYAVRYCDLLFRICNISAVLPGNLSISVRRLLSGMLCKNHTERIPTEYILIYPWLKSVRPYYMQIPVNFAIEDTDDDDQNDVNPNKDAIMPSIST